VVTGASAGIGRAVVELEARDGARVVVTDINDVGRTESIDQVCAAGGEVLFHQTDVTHSSRVEPVK
jgi:NAD(P)-dependent dehydrogenase (short-subunit alcohol dehydrogenase family)